MIFLKKDLSASYNSINNANNVGVSSVWQSDIAYYVLILIAVSNKMVYVVSNHRDDFCMSFFVR